ncbi:hypothetical protein P3T27_006499 [Kitasatospora sp. MAA19]|uniref:DUF6093 family protein n=1 Tax=Kitasatospora sp. MAA19 TaxID=3035090 RepID=UPI002476D572|nr:DUF6093 family protein [Kitasatospora sp. MAA19]MDH6709750.1 hypothetical protein [Kitasatospora sp. MAA19]
MIDPGPALAAGRVAHEALMLDTVRLVRPGKDVYDPATGATGQPDARVLYQGPARVKPNVVQERDVQAGQREVVLRRYQVALPWSAMPLAVDRVVAGDQLIVDASPDLRLAGMTLWVTSVGESSTATAWHLGVEDRS